MRDVLVLIHDDVGQQSRLQAAFDLVRASQGRLLCVDLAEPDAKGARATRGGSLVMEAEVAPLATVRDQIEASGLSAQWIERRDAMSISVAAVPMPCRPLSSSASPLRYATAFDPSRMPNGRSSSTLGISMPISVGCSRQTMCRESVWARRPSTSVFR